MSEPAPLVLVIEDEPQLSRFLSAALKSHGYRSLCAASAQAGEHLAFSHRPDVILLDLGLPDKDGLEVVPLLRSCMDTPIIVISARGKEEDKVDALEAGANDYLTKPFGTRELIARIRVCLRGVAQQLPAASVLEMGDIRLDLAAREVTKKSQRVHLTPNEFKLLAFMAAHVGKVLTHNQILKAVWGSGSGQQAHYVRVYVNQLRQKLEDNPNQPVHFQTELGVGYRLVAQAEKEV